MICAIIPTLNAETSLPDLLAQLKPCVERIIVSDGFSKDGTLATALSYGALLAIGSPGRGQQLARATALAEGVDWLLFIHSDSRLEAGWDKIVSGHIKKHPDAAAYFTLRYESPQMRARFVEFMVWLRNWAWGLPYGDQGLLIPKALYAEIGGYAQMELFEDVDIVQRIGKSRLKRLKARIYTSAEKYERDGFLRRGRRNYRLLRRYLKGESAEALRKEYR